MQLCYTVYISSALALYTKSNFDHGYYFYRAPRHLPTRTTLLCGQEN